MLWSAPEWKPLSRVSLPYIQSSTIPVHMHKHTMLPDCLVSWTNQFLQVLVNSAPKRSKVLWSALEWFSVWFCSFAPHACVSTIMHRSLYTCTCIHSLAVMTGNNCYLLNETKSLWKSHKRLVETDSVSGEGGAFPHKTVPPRNMASGPSNDLWFSIQINRPPFF